MVINPNGERKVSEPHIRLIAGREIRFDTNWTEEVFEVLASEAGLSTITDQHRKIIRALRDFYAYHGPARLNDEPRKSSEISLLEIERLFPGGIEKEARRLYGLPDPKTCNRGKPGCGMKSQ